MLGNDYGKKLVSNISNNGVMEIFHPAGDTLNMIDWNKVINMPTYRLNVDVSVLLICIYSDVVIAIIIKF